MATTQAHAPGGTTFIQRWLARLAFVAIAAALLAVSVAALIVTAAAVWWALAHRGLVRWLAVALAVVVPLGLLALFVHHGLVPYVVLQFGLLALAVVVGRAALRREAIPERLREHPALPRAWPSHPRDRLRQPLVMDRNYHVQKDEILRGRPTISKTSELTKKREGVSGYDRSVP